MKTRKKQTAAKKGAPARPAKRSATGRRPATRLGKGAGAARPERAPAADGSLALAAECTVAEAEALKSGLAQRLREPGPVTLDVSALQRIDTAGLQLLAAFVRDRRNAGLATSWRGRAAALDAAAARLGLSAMLELPDEAGR